MTKLGNLQRVANESECELDTSVPTPVSSPATTKMPFTAMSREECRLVSCPECGAASTYKCMYPYTSDPSKFRAKERIHKKRIDKAQEYRAEHRI